MKATPESLAAGVAAFEAKIVGRGVTNIVNAEDIVRAVIEAIPVPGEPYKDRLDLAKEIRKMVREQNVMTVRRLLYLAERCADFLESGVVPDVLPDEEEEGGWCIIPG